MQYSYPFRIDGLGHTSTVNEEQHIKQMIEQVLFTSLGERVNRPDFGSNINHLVFSPNSPEVASATQLLVQGALQKWLGDFVLVELVQVNSRESTVEVIVQYRIKKDGRQRTVKFEKET